MLLNEDRLIIIISKIAEKCALQSWRYECKELSKNIEHYFGGLVPVTVFGTIDARNIRINVFLKVPPSNTTPRLNEILKQMFDTEAFFYETIIPLYKTVSNFGTLEDFIPDCYYIDTTLEKQVVALKNMNFEGFQRYKRQMFLDFDHVVIAMKELAKFHAFWIIAEQKGKTPENKLLRPYTHIYPIEWCITLKSALRNHTKHFEKSKYHQFLQKLLSNFDVIQMESSSKAKQLVLGHGDYWKENILFKYENGKPISACILDFQMCRLMSPAQDFLTFLLKSYSSPSRLQNFDYFLSLYLGHFNRILEDNNIEQSTYDENFKHDLKVVVKNCVICIFMSFALWLGLEKDTLIKSKDANMKNDNTSQFINIITSIIDDLNALGYITLSIESL